MLLLTALYRELLSYSIFIWLVFVAIAFCTARFGGVLGMFAGHLIIAAMVAGLDLLWVRTEMAAPAGHDAPDMDGVFLVGVLIRVLLINFVLLIVTIPALYSNTNRRTQ